MTSRAFLARRGVLTRELDVVPHERTQSLQLEQGPLQRRLDLVSFVLHATPGPVNPRVEHLAGPVGARLMAEQATRAREARAQAVDERWMLGRPGPEKPPDQPAHQPANQPPEQPPDQPADQPPDQQAGSVSNLTSRPELS